MRGHIICLALARSVVRHWLPRVSFYWLSIASRPYLLDGVVTLILTHLLTKLVKAHDVAILKPIDICDNSLGIDHLLVLFAR